ncbi:hypothetical protein NEMBOFW57_006532 [Staphylotrichum longicolle]|uniref:Uncharacterized protein n=1 Tax=Staphylotrichum longicolle TaxID=669026 RepID=A0AAD4EWS4_9PEZI|nr:hypothetical protein NEMBOFW57_006532 [Staphylotrichum longicolle]
MDDDIDATRATATTSDKLLDDLARRLREAAESDSVSLKEEAIMMMELLNQARFMQEETKRILMLAQAHEAKMKKMVEEQEQVALSHHDAAEIVDRISGGFEEQAKSKAALDTKLDTIAANAITKDDLYQFVDSIQQIAMTLGQTCHSGKNTLAPQANGSSAAHTPTQPTFVATVDPTQTEDQGNKRKRISPPQSEEQPDLARLTEKEKTKLGFMAEACWPMIAIFQRLVPTKHQTDYLSTVVALQSFHRLFGRNTWHAHKILNFMKWSTTEGWCCARQLAKVNTSNLQADGTCLHCTCDCLQIVQLGNERPAHSYSFRLMPVKVMEKTNPK